MIFAVETNILLDILIPDTAHVESSLNYLMNIGVDNELIISEVVYAELGSQFLSSRDLNSFLLNTSIRVVPSNENSLFEASTAWKKYSERKKDVLVCPACGKCQKVTCESCKEIIAYRQHILSDFLIGAHAKIHADNFVTRDRGFYRTYFHDLNILTP
jgi:predicted nucleic acid-binding protein